MKQTLIVFVQDEPGVLNRVSSYIRRKNFNIESISAGQTEKQGITRITLVLNEPSKTKQNIVVSSLKQLVDVYDVIDATKIKSHIREYVLIKIKLSLKEEKEFYEIIDQYNHNVVSSENQIFIIEITGYEEDIESVINSLIQFEIIEIVRSGKVAMVSGDEFHHKPDLMKTSPNSTTFRISD